MMVAALLRRKYLFITVTSEWGLYLIKAFDPCDWFESLAANLAATVAVELTAVLSPLAGDASLHGNDKVVK